MNKETILHKLARMLLAAAGVLCIVNAPSITLWFPYLIGIVMIVTGVFMFIDTYPALRREPEEREKNSSRMTRSLLLFMLGVITLLNKSEEMPFIGVVWGLLGLMKGGRGLTLFMCGSWRSRRNQIVLVKAVIGIVLSCILLFDPVAAVGKHIPILGLQIIAYAALKMDVEKKPKEVVTGLHEHMDELAQVSRNSR